MTKLVLSRDRPRGRGDPHRAERPRRGVPGRRRRHEQPARADAPRHVDRRRHVGDQAQPDRRAHPRPAPRPADQVADEGEGMARFPLGEHVTDEWYPGATLPLPRHPQMEEGFELFTPDDEDRFWLLEGHWSRGFTPMCVSTAYDVLWGTQYGANMYQLPPTKGQAARMSGVHGYVSDLPCHSPWEMMQHASRVEKLVGPAIMSFPTLWAERLEDIKGIARALRAGRPRVDGPARARRVPRRVLGLPSVGLGSALRADGPTHRQLLRVSRDVSRARHRRERRDAVLPRRGHPRDGDRSRALGARHRGARHGNGEGPRRPTTLSPHSGRDRSPGGRMARHVPRVLARVRLAD